MALIALMAALLTQGSALASPTLPAESPAGVATESSAYCADPEELDLLRRLNEYRAEHGVGELTLSVTLGAAAKHHSESMATFNYFDGSHDLHFEGENQDETITWQQNIANHGYPDNTHTSRAENLAAGFETAAETLLQWQNSPSHDEHLLNPKYKAVGIGRAFNPASEFRWYWTVTFGSLVDSTASACDGSAAGEGTPAPGSELKIARSGRNGSSTDSNVVFDGDETTSWHTTKARTPTSGYVWIDLGDIHTISRIEYLFSEKGGAAAFQIQVSNDRENWEVVAERENPKIGRWQSVEWNGEARYVRFYFTNPDEAPVLGYLAEVRVYA